MIGQSAGTRALAVVLGLSLVGGIALAQVPNTPARPAPVAHLARSKAKPIASPAKTSLPRPAAAKTEANAAPPSYVVKRVLEIGGPMHQGDWFWDEKGAPAAGEMIVTVDLAAQSVSVFRDGYEIGTAAIIYGSDTTPTPLGIFPITQKDADHVSNLYDAPMPYMLRLTGDGISIHGSKVGDGYVTHGCIGVPTAFAKKVFGVVRLGDKVIVTRGEMLGVGQAIKAA